MADDIKVNLKVVADPQGAAEAGKADAKSYNQSYGKETANYLKNLSEPARKRLLADPANKELADIWQKISSGADKATKSIENANAAFSRFQKAGWKSPQMRQAQTPALPDFIKDPGFFTRGKIIEKLGDKERKENERTDKERERRNMRYMRLTESMVKNYSMLSGVVASPGGGLTTMFAARQVFQARRDQASRQRLLGGAGESITGSVMATAGLVAAATAVGAAFMGLKKIVDETVNAFGRGKSLYTKASLEGGLGFSTKRATQAQVLGVNEDDVMKFGAALAYIQPKIQAAQKVLQDTATPLAKVAIDFEILKVNMQALGAKVAEYVSPIIEDIIDALSVLAGDNAINDIIKGLAGALGILAESLLFLGKVVATTLQTIADAIAAIIWFATHPFSSNRMAGFDVMAKDFKKNMAMFSKGDATKGELAPPQAFMKQMPASAWEKMGLVVGGIGGTNYNQQTANNTKEMVKELQRLNRVSGSPKGLQATPALAA